MSLGLMTKLYEDNLTGWDKEDESQMQADQRSEFELSGSRVKDERSSARAALDA